MYFELSLRFRPLVLLVGVIGGYYLARRAFRKGIMAPAPAAAPASGARRGTTGPVRPGEEETFEVRRDQQQPRDDRA